MNYTIDKNVPIPKRVRPVGALKAKVLEMKPGDSMYFEKQSTTSYAMAIIRKQGWKGESHKWKDGFRVWRIE